MLWSFKRQHPCKGTTYESCIKWTSGKIPMDSCTRDMLSVDVPDLHMIKRRSKQRISGRKADREPFPLISSPMRPPEFFQKLDTKLIKLFLGRLALILDQVIKCLSPDNQNVNWSQQRNNVTIGNWGDLELNDQEVAAFRLEGSLWDNRFWAHLQCLPKVTGTLLPSDRQHEIFGWPCISPFSQFCIGLFNFIWLFHWDLTILLVHCRGSWLDALTLCVLPIFLSIRAWKI